MAIDGSKISFSRKNGSKKFGEERITEYRHLFVHEKGKGRRENSQPDFNGAYLVNKLNEINGFTLTLEQKFYPREVIS